MMHKADKYNKNKRQNQLTMNNKAYKSPVTESIEMLTDVILSGSGSTPSPVAPDLEVITYNPQAGDDCD